MSNVFIAFQKNEESRCIVEAIVADNPTATVNEQPAMVKVDVPDQMVIRRSSISSSGETAISVCVWKSWSLRRNSARPSEKIAS